MRAFAVLYRREMRSYFVSPVAYIVLTLFFILSGFFFYNTISGGGQATMSGVFGVLANLLLFTTPFITMRLIAEEKRSGTMELLLTSPVRPLDIILAKFFAAWSLVGIVIAGTLFYVLLILIHSPMEFGPLFLGYLGLILLSGAFVALGLLASSVAESQMSAGILGFGLSFILVLLEWVGQGGKGAVHAVLRELSLFNHFGDFYTGIFDFKHVIFFLFWAVVCISFAVKSIEARLLK
jgi:ABC-2 type transport system permease protein